MKTEKTAKEWLTEIQKGDASLNNVPEELRTAEIYLAAVQQNGCELGYVPEGLHTLDPRLEAVRQDGWALKLVPEALQAQVKAALTLLTQGSCEVRKHI